MPRWFIEFFTDPGDVVLDPFAGSGTPLAAALALGRDALGIEFAPAHARRCEAAVASAMSANDAVARAAAVDPIEPAFPKRRAPRAARPVSKDSVPL